MEKSKRGKVRLVFSGRHSYVFEAPPMATFLMDSMENGIPLIFVQKRVHGEENREIVSAACLKSLRNYWFLQSFWQGGRASRRKSDPGAKNGEMTTKQQNSQFWRKKCPRARQDRNGTATEQEKLWFAKPRKCYFLVIR